MASGDKRKKLGIDSARSGLDELEVLSVIVNQSPAIRSRVIDILRDSKRAQEQREVLFEKKKRKG